MSEAKCVNCGFLGMVSEKGQEQARWFEDSRWRRGDSVHSPTTSHTDYSELAEPHRAKLRDDEFSTYYPACGKGLLIFRLSWLKKSDQEALLKEYVGDRDCRDFIEHAHGLSPQGHIDRELSLKDEEDRRRWESNQKLEWSAVGFLIGIATNIVVQVIIWYFQLLPPR